MKEINKYRVINVPKLLIDNYEDMKISTNNLVSIIKILGLNQDMISVAKLANSDILSRDAVGELLSSDILDTHDLNGDLVLDINSIYQKLEKISNKPISNKDLIETYTKRIEAQLKRQLNKKEILIIDEWIDLDISLDTIEEGIRISQQNEVDSIEYIDKVVRQNNLRK